MDKYTWVDLGSSYLPNEITAAFLWAQMEEARSIIARRIAIWNRYHEAFAPLEAEGKVVRPVVPPDCRPTAHVYYLLMPTLDDRTRRGTDAAALDPRKVALVGSRGPRQTLKRPLPQSPEFLQPGAE